MFRSIVIAVISIVSTASFGAVSNFEDKTLAPNSFYDGSDLAGDFTSGGVKYHNSFNTTFGTMDGFGYSNVNDTTTPGFGNQFAAITGAGAGGAGNYGISFIPGVDARLTLPMFVNPVSIDITNTTYAYLSMTTGDMFAKKFGGASGNDPDYFKLTITGLDNSDGVVGTVNFMLADFTFADNTQDYIVNTWKTVDLTSLAGSRTLAFSLSSTDNITFEDQTFMNTPAYFALDNVTFVPEPASLSLMALAGMMLLGRRSAGH